MARERKSVLNLESLLSTKIVQNGGKRRSGRWLLGFPGGVPLVPLFPRHNTLLAAARESPEYEPPKPTSEHLPPALASWRSHGDILIVI